MKALAPAAEAAEAGSSLRRWHGRFDGLDGLRWFASIQVVLSHESDVIMPFLWGSIWTQMFFLLSGFVLAYAEMVRPKGVPRLSQWQYTWRRLRKIYPAYLIMIGISMLQSSHTEFAWKTLILNVFLLQTWFPLVDETNGRLQSVVSNWVGVSWFLSALLLYWQFLRPAARCATRMSMKVALLSLLCLWLFTWVLLVIWQHVHLVSGYFMMLVLHEGPLGYAHVFLSGVVLARIFVLLIYMDADEPGEDPDLHTERLTLRQELELPRIFKLGTTVALLCYLPLFALPVVWDSPFMAFCHNGGMLPMMCLLLLALSSEMDLLAPCLGSSVAKVLGRISYCQYIIQGQVRMAMLHQLYHHFWPTFPVFLLVLMTCAYLLEWFVSLLLDRICHDVLQEHAPLVPSESSDESSSEEHGSTTDLWACGV